MSIGLFIAAALIVFLWSPQTQLAIARYVGQAKRQFEQAIDELSVAPNTVTQHSKVTKPFPMIIIGAKSPGITTEDKTKGDAAKEIAARNVN